MDTLDGNGDPHTQEPRSARVEAALDGQLRYDELSAPEQAVVRGLWEQRIEAGIDDLNLAAEFAAEGRSWVELDGDAVVERSR